MDRHTVMCTYRVKEGAEEAFLGHLRKHWPTLREFGLVTDEQALIFRGSDESRKSFFVEIFHWKAVEGHTIAEQTPDILAIWEKMGQLVEARLNRPAMEFPWVQQITQP